MLCRHRKKNRQRGLLIRNREESVRARVTNEARTGNISGILNIIVQVPIQIGANAQNFVDSNNNTTTVI